MTEPIPRTLPPDPLRERVAGTPDAEWFVKSGAQSVLDIRGALRAVGRPLESFQDILDFGCGCGRILAPLLAELPEARLSGVDIDDEAMAWLRSEYPQMTLRTVNPLPPLPFPADSFDLVYCHSVFTHLDTNYQDQWLAELRRVARPGAMLVISFSGAAPFARLEQDWKAAGSDPAPLAEKLRRDGCLYLAEDSWTGGPFPDFYHTMFHTEAYIRRHWGQWFTVRANLRKGSLDFQDFVVMENPPKATEAPRHGELPIPPEPFRRNVGPLDPAAFDNPSGELVFPEISEANYKSVFDFGCGCGRIARQMLQQRVRPERYVGLDIHQGMVEWDRENLAVVDPRFHFLAHDVYSLTLAPKNTRRDFAPFPVGDGEFTLVNAHSVFTHILLPATISYLREVYRILAPGGVARTTWFFFDKRGLPWLEPEQVCLYVNEIDPTNAVIYDREWFMATMGQLGFVVAHIRRPDVPGHQWTVFLKKDQDTPPAMDLLSEESADWLCCVPPPEGLRKQLRSLAEDNRQLRGSLSWRLTAPLRWLGGFYRKT